MWHVSNEAFMQPVKHILSDLKIRASYGVNGNQPGSLYGYMGLYSLGQSYMGGLGSYESAISNPNLGWEKNYNLNVGLDVSFINRIFLSVEYYNRDTKDLLYSLPISATTGFTNYLSNVGQRFRFPGGRPARCGVCQLRIAGGDGRPSETGVVS